MDNLWKTITELAVTFEASDTARALSIEEQWTLQVLKIGEEFGEAAQAVVGVRGTNPRKGQSHSWEDVHGEVADTAITALVALARMRPDAADYFAQQIATKSSRFLPQQATFDDAVSSEAS
ncbi:MazG-like family protein [Streptomyces sp. G-G2]|uniref:MazG-like family protein n=1 Tax=Streptomyces sp. G-G2 TaxID=3046201 RepID=UPI0024B9AAA6|nr:MazG-like family protein [Streptomyces sp. G-G2]MDJ0383151.1 MazG-like family protein [Streptomyces sp. G-G2]